MKKLVQNVCCIFALGLVSQFTFAQCGPVGNGTGGSLNCFYSDSAHDCLYIGGGFHSSGMDTLNYCGYWNDSTFHHMGMGFHGTNDSVWCFTVFNGELYVGGSFTQAGGVPTSHIARWDGNNWFAVGDGFDHPVHALATFNGQLVAGGEFTMSGSTTTNYLAYWDGSQWAQVAGGMNGDVDVMCEWNDTLYIAGDFTMAGNLTVNRICSWDGSNFAALSGGFTSGMMGPCTVYSLCVYNGNLFAGGMFSHAGSSNMDNIAMWNGSSWNSIGNIGGGMGGHNAVNALCVYNGQLYLGGNFGSCGGHSSSNIGMWDGSNWSTIGTGMNGTVKSLSVYHNKLYIGGTFTDAAGVNVNNIARYSSETGIVSPARETISLSLYPNPASGAVHADWVQNNSTAVIISIYDITGRKVMEKDLGIIPAGNRTIDLPVQDLDNGIYTCQLEVGTNRITGKFSVLK